MLTTRPDIRLVAPLVTLLTYGVLGPAAAARGGDRQHQVLVLFGARPDAQFAVVAQRQLPSLFKQNMSEGVDYYSEYLDVPRFADPEYQAAYVDFLRVKYGAKRIDLVVVMGNLGDEFMARLRGIFPESPVVFYALRAPDVRMANSTGLVNQFHFRRSLNLAVALQPDLAHVFVVSGAGPSDRMFERQARKEFLPLERRLDVTYLSGLVTRDLEARLRTLPPRSAVFVVLVTKDGAGEKFHEMDYLSRVAAVATAPTYSWADAAVDSGIVGGTRRDHPAEMKAIVALAVRVLQGAHADDIPVSSPNLDVDQVDWRQLRRWRINEARVPAGTIVLFREPSLWDRYQGYIIGSLALLLTQTTLVAALLVQRFKRRQTELELRDSQTKLRASHDRIQHLGRRLLHEQEEERTRVARELHDDVCQQLGCLVLELEMLRRDDQHRRKADRVLADAVDIAQGAVKSIRDLSHQLHSAKLELVGLVSAVRGLTSDLSGPTLSIAFSHDAVPARLPDEIALCLFRVVQEALRNVVTHSGATHASVQLRGQEHGLALSIVDNGIGFDVDDIRTNGLGLLSISERLQSVGGRLDIRSEPGSGTQLEIVVPVAAPPLSRQALAM
jgi:signal transduction histidine kinase